MAGADDPNADPIDDDLDSGKSDDQFRPTSQQIKDLKIAHDNCGHPTNRDFARMIKLGNGTTVHLALLAVSLAQHQHFLMQ